LSNFGVKWRKRWGMSQDAAASVLGVGQRTLRRQEAKEKLPKLWEYAMRYLSIKWRDEA